MLLVLFVSYLIFSIQYMECTMCTFIRTTHKFIIIYRNSKICNWIVEEKCKHLKLALFLFFGFWMGIGYNDAMPSDERYFYISSSNVVIVAVALLFKHIQFEWAFIFMIIRNQCEKRCRSNDKGNNILYIQRQ